MEISSHILYCNFELKEGNKLGVRCYWILPSQINEFYLILVQLQTEDLTVAIQCILYDKVVKHNYSGYRYFPYLVQMQLLVDGRTW